MYLLNFLFSAILATAFAADLKKVKDFRSESKDLLEKAEKESSYSKKTLHLEKLKASLEKAMETYKTKDSSDDGTAVTFFYFQMEPAFDLGELKKPSATDCAGKDNEVKRDDLMGRSEEEPLSEDAQLVLKWIDTLCK